MVDVRVGDEWTLLAGRTYRIIEPWEGESCGALNPEGERVGLMLDDFADPDDPLELTWADPRVGDEWTNSSVSFRISAIHCTWSGEVRVDAEPLVGGFQYNRGMTVEAMRAVGWRPAPRSPKGTPIVNAVGRVIGTTVPRPAKPLTITTRDEAVAAFGKGSMFDAPIQKPPATIVIPVPANPAPQVGDVWTYEGWTGAKRVERVDGDAVFFDGARDGSHGPWAHSELSSPNWHRVSAAPAKPARQCRYRDCDPRPLEDVALKPPPTWRDLFHEVAANPPRYGRETWGKRAVKALWVRAAANALENVRRSYAKQVAGNGARQHVERDVDAEYRRLGGEVW